MSLPDASGPVRRVPPLPDRARPRAAWRLLRLPRSALRGAAFGLCGVGVAASIGFFLRPPSGGRPVSSPVWFGAFTAATLVGLARWLVAVGLLWWLVSIALFLLPGPLRLAAFGVALAVLLLLPSLLARALPSRSRSG